MSEWGNCRICDKQMKKGIWANIEDEPSSDDQTLCRVCALNEKRRLEQESEAERERQEERQRNLVALAKNILISTTDQIYGREITISLGIARGVASSINFPAGHIAYDHINPDPREEALQRMQIDAVIMEADAVVGVNFTTSINSDSTKEVFAFGTAVKLREIPTDE